MVTKPAQAAISLNPPQPLKLDAAVELALTNYPAIKTAQAQAAAAKANIDLARTSSITADIEGSDLGRAASEVNAAIKRAGDAPKGSRVDVRGQVPQMEQTISGLRLGVLIAIVAIFLLLSANFQSPRVALVVLSTIPAVLTGVALSLWLTGTTLNVQSFMGAIMAIGVSVANAILLITFAEASRREGLSADEAATLGASSRLRPILMMSFAMIAGMFPIALALGQGGEQTAPLGRAVIGGLSASTIAVLTILPLTFAVVQRRASLESASVHPDDLAGETSKKSSLAGCGSALVFSSVGATCL